MRQAQHDAIEVRGPHEETESQAERNVKRIESFAADYRARVLELTARAKAFEDLADSFPALLFALATDYADPSARESAMAALTSGASLREAAERLGLPSWLRKLPAQCFTAPLTTVPRNPDFGARVCAFIPTSPPAAGPWFSRVLYAYAACGSEYALWVARHCRSSNLQTRDDSFAYLAAWAWHADKPDTPGATLLRRPWSPALSLRRAIDEMTAWRRRIALALCLGSGVTDTWLTEGNARGYDFVALKTVGDFIAESEAMDNCLDQYANRLEGSVVRIFSIRKQGRSVADVEISCHDQEVGMPAISQLRGARNRRAPAEVWQAAYAWLGNQAMRPVSASLVHGRDAERRQMQRQFWQPYLSALSGDAARRFEMLALGRQALRRLKARRPQPTALRSANLERKRRTASA
jgi:hypothetical protein